MNTVQCNFRDGRPADCYVVVRFSSGIGETRYAMCMPHAVAAVASPKAWRVQEHYIEHVKPSTR